MNDIIALVFDTLLSFYCRSTADFSFACLIDWLGLSQTLFAWSLKNSEN